MRPPVKPCSVIVRDREASRGGSLVTRPCGAPTRMVLTINGDTMFAICQRHDGRLRRGFPGGGFWLRP